eukprot:6208285-Pleurochrysis_carterae.AAC.2
MAFRDARAMRKKALMLRVGLDAFARGTQSSVHCSKAFCGDLSLSLFLRSPSLWHFPSCTSPSLSALASPPSPFTRSHPLSFLTSVRARARVCACASAIASVCGIGCARFARAIPLLASAPDPGESKP